ncbi:MAG: hypothetical protein AB8G23_20640 [Myxococcota bacterium]
MTRVRETARLLGVLLMSLGVTGCSTGFFERGDAQLAVANSFPSSVVGQTVVYRFLPGRIYQARYGCSELTFVLLEPKQTPPPTKTMPYASRMLRTGLELVVWKDPEYHTTFVVDFEERSLHASALRPGGMAFLGEAEILEMRPTLDSAGAAVECAEEHSLRD